MKKYIIKKNERQNTSYASITNISVEKNDGNPCLLKICVKLLHFYYIQKFARYIWTTLQYHTLYNKNTASNEASVRQNSRVNLSAL